ncbi:hypothetical protein BGZ80_006890 [Entomortierella chlamydospora]|uniref:N-acetyltransferase domain-containing protein n=1 Tax=Entomortierella chlamydospora TaxID=101097 RepID=A0A9P6T2A0_9FUNG|nr:hypothetical protein BGZ79_007510 [Entomortierella chlamydospora]KAG0018671.1 hypothetical protein BGZ80_006890 [Entomortierella chlamydospora]
MPSSISIPSLLQPISNEDACSSYLAELHNEMPYAASQFGLVLTTALERRQAGKEPVVKQPHFRSKAIPVPGSDNKEPIDFTNIDVTVSGHVTTFSARCEPFLMRAAAAVVDAKSSAEELADRASSENFSKALKQFDDPLIQGHCENFLSLIPAILEYSSAEQARVGQDPTNVGCYCINDIWKDPINSLLDNRLQLWTRAVKFVISEEDLLKVEPEIRARCQQLEEEQGLVLGPMVESDVKLMIERNKISFDEEYGKWIIKRSMCFRNKQGDMVAWGGTHGDFSIAALHVLPEYRKAGLGKLILNSLALLHVRLARDALTSSGSKEDDAIPASSLFAHSDCVEDNLPTMAFMERCGWRRIGNYLWFGVPYNANAEAN